jgi:iron complex outermembrane recepter protein
MAKRFFWPVFTVGSVLITSGAYAGTAADAAGPTADETNDNSIQEVVVTAQKRSENLVNVPASVTTLSSDSLSNSGMSSLNDVVQLVPGLQIASQGAFSLPFIRGIGTTISGAGFPSNIATYVDGFYRPTGLSNDLTLIDVSDVEVLKGPQGTLFGRNATGGAILVSTQAPSFTPSVKARVSFGSFDTGEVGVFATGPLIGDVLAGSISTSYGYSNGYIRNIYTGLNADVSYNESVHGKLLFTPFSSLSVTLGYEWSKVSDPTGNSQGAYNGWSDGALVPGTIVATNPRTTSDDSPTGHVVRDSRYHMTIDYDMGWASLKSYSFYLTERDWDHFDLDSSSAPLLGSNWHLFENTMTEEINLTSATNDRFNWVVGAYYYHDYNWFPGYNLTAAGGEVFNPAAVVFNAGVHTNSGAVYADGTYKLVDRLNLTVGGRYNGDFLRGDFTYYPAPQVRYGTSWKRFTPRAILRYETTDNSNVYVSYSQGYKTGALNAQGGSTDPVQPEKVNAYEVGYKVAGHSLRAETAAYFYDYKDLQVQTINDNQSFLQNAAAARIYGWEGHIAADLSEGFQADLGANYNHAHYTNFPDANVFHWSPTAGVESLQADDSGKSLILSPAFSGNATLSYRRMVAGGPLLVTTNYHYQTAMFFDTDNIVKQGGYGVLNLRAGWTTPDSHYTFSVYGKNLTNKSYLNFVLDGNVAFQSLYARPAEFGGEISVKF